MPNVHVNKDINRIYDGVEAETGTSQASFQIISLIHLTRQTADQKSPTTFSVHHWMSVPYSACNLHEITNEVVEIIKIRLY